MPETPATLVDDSGPTVSSVMSNSTTDSIVADWKSTGTQALSTVTSWPEVVVPEAAVAVYVGRA